MNLSQFLYKKQNFLTKYSDYAIGGYLITLRTITLTGKQYEGFFQDT